MNTTTLSDLMKKYAESKVNVSYPDGKGNHQVTVRDITDRFLQEGAEWRKQFFTELLTFGECRTRLGGLYELVR